MNSDVNVSPDVVAVSVLFILLIRHKKDDKDQVEFIAGKTSLGDAVDGAIKIFTVAVTIVVVAVPLVVTLTLAYSMRKMMADKVLVSFIILFTINLSGAFW
uniref:Uncharacterized protein n=1 Tax=Lactuca sativa TaxID=4236 RepID=A0A9R1XS40_LACSA|nr:hypothetical protein LSAT_V11C200065570 [Lactuca sativa]